MFSKFLQTRAGFKADHQIQSQTVFVYSLLSLSQRHRTCFHFSSSVPSVANTTVREQQLIQNHQHTQFESDPAGFIFSLSLEVSLSNRTCAWFWVGLSFSMRSFSPSMWHLSKAVDDEKQGGMQRQARYRHDREREVGRDVGYWHIYTLGVTEVVHTVPDNSSHLWQ